MGADPDLQQDLAFFAIAARKHRVNRFGVLQVIGIKTCCNDGHRWRGGRCWRRDWLCGRCRRLGCDGKTARAWLFARHRQHRLRLDLRRPTHWCGRRWQGFGRLDLFFFHHRQKTYADARRQLDQIVLDREIKRRVNEQQMQRQHNNAIEQTLAQRRASFSTIQRWQGGYSHSIS